MADDEKCDNCKSWAFLCELSGFRRVYCMKNDYIYYEPKGDEE